ncbi:MAG: hypothetical protein COA61_002275 [Zetaproteobacteria bacterium]|nr:hypothetical protein [Zetaproteobacteria bacterium]
MHSNLRKEITVILIVKIIALFAIWYFFFSSTPTPVDFSHVLLPSS